MFIVVGSVPALKTVYDFQQMMWIWNCVSTMSSEPFLQPMIHHQPAPAAFHCQARLLAPSLTWPVRGHACQCVVGSSRLEPVDPLNRHHFPSHRALEKLLVGHVRAS